MEWQTDLSKVRLNHWHICYNAELGGEGFNAMPVEIEGKIKWVIDPWRGGNAGQMFVKATHYMFFPEPPVR